MSDCDDQLAKILARLDSSNRKSEKGTRWAVVAAFIAALGSLIAAVGSFFGSWMVAKATLESTDKDNVSEQAAFVATQRRDSYATLGHTVREHIRSLQLARDSLERNELPDPPVSIRNGEAYRETREVAVDTELVGDDTAGQMARCIVAGFDHIGLDLRRIEDEVRKGAASASMLDDAKTSLRELQQYESTFIEYGAEHLFPDSATNRPRAGGTDPACSWELRDFREP
ncbi:hypothetical protein [Nocardioides xinjiangensis]|uniref:hypothetical protein n=1 Tax=Nocardioides xinjiangensis TaxID=2817376 RepID=UPI001B3004D7|nr:hypothetical protein [Nocardioides sp. SYSU D00514]